MKIPGDLLMPYKRAAAWLIEISRAWLWIEGTANRVLGNFLAALAERLNKTIAGRLSPRAVHSSLLSAKSNIRSSITWYFVALCLEGRGA